MDRYGIHPKSFCLDTLACFCKDDVNFSLMVYLINEYSCEQNDRGLALSGKEYKFNHTDVGRRGTVLLLRIQRPPSQLRKETATIHTHHQKENTRCYILSY